MYERLKQSYYDNINNQNFVEDYYDVKYNKLMPENIIRERMDEIYNNTFWKDIALEPPYIINNDSFVIEVWHIKKNTLYGY